MTNTPNDNTAADTTDDGVIEFVLPEDLPHQLVIVKDDEDTIVARPLPLFTDELLPPFILGETDIRVELSHLVMLQNAAIALLAQSKREILYAHFIRHGPVSTHLQQRADRGGMMLGMEFFYSSNPC